MLRTVFMAATACFAIAVAGLVASMGGCAADPDAPGGSAEREPDAPSAPAAEKLHPGRIARLSTGVTVDAVWFDADKPHGASGRVRLEPGVWLAPPEVFRSPLPDCCDERPGHE